MKGLKIFCLMGLVSMSSLLADTGAGVSEKTGLYATAELRPTSGNRVTGVVSFRQVAGGVKVIAEVHGLTPGKHGFHIHEYGDCSSPDGASAGGHFNPTHKKHGGPDHLERHVGDLGNIVADDFGLARYERIDPIIELVGPNTIIGRSVIIHANGDDFNTQPTGNAGGRVACGPIVQFKTASHP
jgi:Cu-Zn family superoxide dismutase